MIAFYKRQWGQHNEGDNFTIGVMRGYLQR
jgi:hypothetical protein